MADSDQSSKTEAPTPKRIGEALERGQFAKAPEIAMVFVLAAAFVVLAFLLRKEAVAIGQMAHQILSNLHRVEVNSEMAVSGARDGFRFILWLLFPLLMAVTLASILAGGLQSGFRLTPKVLEAKFDKLNPVEGFKRIFNTKALVQFGVDLLKFIAVAAILWSIIHRIVNDPIFSMPVPVGHVGSFMADTALAILIRLIFAIAIIAVINFLFQRHKHIEGLKMTKQEVKDELKQTQGDPLIKQTQRKMAVQLLQKQMLAAVPTADVVVTNPTHFAVALRYVQGEDSAPVVLAKGKDQFARRIKKLAAEHGVPQVENVPVARMLFKFGGVGKGIPLELYQVVAEILAQVYKTHKSWFRDLKQRRQEALVS